MAYVPGFNGTGPEVGAIQYKTYVLPTLLYGLEAVVLQSDEISDLDTYHRQNLRFMQHMPKSTAIPAIHLMIGILPTKAMLDIRTLSFLRNILAVDVPSPPALFIRELITRQLAMKDSESSGWSAHVRSL